MLGNELVDCFFGLASRVTAVFVAAVVPVIVGIEVGVDSVSQKNFVARRELVLGSCLLELPRLLWLCVCKLGLFQNFLLRFIAASERVVIVFKFSLDGTNLVERLAELRSAGRQFSELLLLF